MSEVVENPSTVNRVKKALSAFENNNAGWQEAWAYALGAIATDSIHRTPYQATENDRQMKRAFILKTADLIKDESNSNLVFWKKRETGSPVKRISKQRRDRAVAIMYALCSEKAKRLGLDDVPSHALMFARKALSGKIELPKIDGIRKNNKWSASEKKQRKNLKNAIKTELELDNLIAEWAENALANMK